jgi:hypothetical protein
VDDDFTDDEFARAFEDRLGDVLRASLHVAQAAAARHTPSPQVGDVWKVRWQEAVGAVLVTALERDRQFDGAVSPGALVSSLRVVPVSFDEVPDESAVLAPAFTHDLGFDLCLWVDDEAEVPARVLECKVGHFTVPGVSGLPRGSRNWGPTDPRTLARAHVQDLVDEMVDASWTPARGGHEVSISALLANADIRRVAEALGSVPAAMQLRKGQAWLTPEQAERLAPVLSRSADELLAANPALPDELVTVMDQPSVRLLVDELAEQRQLDEVTAWRRAAFGAYALAAREHKLSAVPSWVGRVRAYFDATLPGDGDDREASPFFRPEYPTDGGLR